jgi:hypothetical protein
MARSERQGRKQARSEAPASSDPTNATTSATRRARSRAAQASSAPLDLPGWLAPALFAVVTLLLFGAFVFSSGMLYGGDTISLGYTARKLYADAIRGGDFPLWSPHILGGTPFLEALSAGDSLYPTALLLLVMEPYRALGWKLVLHVFAAGAFTYGWTRSLGRSRAASLVAGIAYLLTPYIVTLVWPGNDGKLMVASLAPLLFWSMESTFKRRGLLPFVGVAASVALVILTTQLQMAYFLFGAAGAFYAFRCWESSRDVQVEEQPSLPYRRNAFASFALFLTASVVGASATTVQLVPTFDYTTSLSRRVATTTQASSETNKEYAASWSLHPEEIAAMVVPEFVGANVGDPQKGGTVWTNNYWGRNGGKFNSEYAGVVVLLLALVSFVGGARKQLRWFFAGLGAFALLYGLGAHTPVWHVAYAVLPGINLFRAAGMASFLFSFAAVTLVAFGVDRLLELCSHADESAASRTTRVLWIACGVIGLGFLLAASGALESIWTSVIYEDIGPRAAVLAANRPFITRGFLFATVLAAATAGIVWAALRGALPRAALVGGLGLLVAIDLWRVDAPFIEVIDMPTAMQSVMHSPAAQPDAIVTELLNRKASEPPFRVAVLGDDQGVGLATYGIELVGGHHPNDVQRYRELLGMQGSENAENIGNPNIMRLLGIRYLVWPTAQQGGEPQDVEIVSRSTIGGQTFQSLIPYPGLPRARLVAEAEILSDGDDVARVLQEDFDPARTAVLAEAPPTPLAGGDPVGDVTWVDRSNDRMHLRVASDREALLIVADNWHPGWHAVVDGEEVPVLRAYHTLRAVPIAAGSHEVEMYYHPAILHWSAYGSLATVLLLIVVAVVSWRRGRAQVLVAEAA